MRLCARAFEGLESCKRFLNILIIISGNRQKAEDQKNLKLWVIFKHLSRLYLLYWVIQYLFFWKFTVITVLKHREHFRYIKIFLGKNTVPLRYSKFFFVENIVSKVQEKIFWKKYYTYWTFFWYSIISKFARCLVIL
jgi:hypothetical protein